MNRGLILILFGLFTSFCVQGGVQAMGGRERERYGNPGFNNNDRGGNRRREEQARLERIRQEQARRQREEDARLARELQEQEEQARREERARLVEQARLLQERVEREEQARREEQVRRLQEQARREQARLERIRQQEQARRQREEGVRFVQQHCSGCNHNLPMNQFGAYTRCGHTFCTNGCLEQLIHHGRECPECGSTDFTDDIPYERYMARRLQQEQEDARVAQELQDQLDQEGVEPVPAPEPQAPAQQLCAICQEQRPMNQFRAYTTCGHTFCTHAEDGAQSCVDQLAQMRQPCPVCRSTDFI